MADTVFTDERGAGIACGQPEPEVFDLDRTIAVGFGAAYVTRDGVEVLDGERAMQRAQSEADYITGHHAEALASADPDHVWEIVFVGPLSGATFTRQPDGRWIATRRDEGFA